MEPPFNVFVSNKLLTCSSGYLTGSISLSSRAAFVFGIRMQKADSERIIGYWNGSNFSGEESVLDNLKKRKQFEKDDVTCTIILKKDTSDCFHCEIHIFTNSSIITSQGLVILYDPYYVLQSYIFMKSQPIEFQKKGELKMLDNQYSLGETIGDVMTSFLQQPSLPGEIDLCKQQNLPPCVTAAKKYTQTLLNCLILLWSRIWCLLCSGRLLTKPLFNSAVYQLLYEKSKRCHQVISAQKGLVFNQFIAFNISAQHAFDSFFGILILYFIVSFSITDSIAFSTLDWADDVAGRLKNLTQWLMGAPAGLKLNAQLTTFLSHFYIYHIYIWTGYLILLRRVMPWFIMCGAMSGIIGISFQLAFVKDVISLLTLHIYCFYVYAARIYNLQMYALGSLWKLFRGKKWNVLRHRVDSAEYNTDQLFVGTLIFTVLLFLLPTTLLYYAVFTSLRLVTLSAQGLLTNLIKFINDLPLYTLMLRMLKPKLIAGATLFKVVDANKDNSTLVLQMETSQLPLNELIAVSAPYLNVPREDLNSWVNLLSCIVTGKLIYPWMDAPEETMKDVKHQE